jgi:pimeloyl-ACP methyl ester carboxylesterase
MEFATSADGTRIAFQRQRSGEAVLLVHGTMASNEAWALVAPLLSERFTVIAMDRRGHGDSELGPSHATHLEAQDVSAVIEAVGVPVHLVGHSGGARVALAVPQHSNVSSASAVDTSEGRRPIRASHCATEGRAAYRARLTAQQLRHRDPLLRGTTDQRRIYVVDYIANPNRLRHNYI